MNKTTEALKMAIEYIEKQEIKLSFDSLKAKADALNACYKALESQEQEPVGYVSALPIVTPQAIRKDKNDVLNIPLYTHPAQPLSDDEIHEIVEKEKIWSILRIARAIEQAHGIGEKK